MVITAWKRNRALRIAPSVILCYSFLYVVIFTGRSISPTNTATEPKEETHNLDRRQDSTFVASGALRTNFGLQDCAELAWLGLSRLEAAQHSLNPYEGDAFAFQLLRLGARWWPSCRFYSKHSRRMTEIPCGYHFPPRIHVGYTSTGEIWVFNTADDWLRQSGDADELPKDWARIIMAWTMDERCAVLERLGATMCANVEDCLDVPESLEEGTKAGRRYGCLLKNMEEESSGGYLELRLDNL